MFGRKCSCFVRFEDCILFVGPLFEVVYCAIVCDTVTVASRLEGTDRTSFLPRWMVVFECAFRSWMSLTIQLRRTRDGVFMCGNGVTFF